MYTQPHVRKELMDEMINEYNSYKNEYSFYEFLAKFYVETNKITYEEFSLYVTAYTMHKSIKL